MPRKKKPTQETQRVFDFAVRTNIPMPANIPARATSARDLPFQAKYDDMLKEVQAGKQAMIYVPHEFWVERGADKEKVDGTYSKGKLRDQFRKWQKAGGHGEVKVDIQMLELSGKEGHEGIDKPGIGVWMTKTAN